MSTNSCCFFPVEHLSAACLFKFPRADTLKEGGSTIATQVQFQSGTAAHQHMFGQNFKYLVSTKFWEGYWRTLFNSFPHSLSLSRSRSPPFSLRHFLSRSFAPSLSIPLSITLSLSPSLFLSLSLHILQNPESQEDWTFRRAFPPNMFFCHTLYQKSCPGSKRMWLTADVG